jgi:hypothetical protein
MLGNLCEQLGIDGVKTVVIDTGYKTPLPKQIYDWNVTVLGDNTQPPNISRWWNFGLNYIKMVEGPKEHVVAILNDDLVIPSGFVTDLAGVILETNAAAAYPDQHGHFLTGEPHVLVHTKAEPVSIYTRMCGYAFALRGSLNLRADETLQWWYGDDDLDWRARQAGGSVLVGGLKVQHLRPNESTVGALAEQAGRDRQTFADKWGGRTPW